MRRSATGRSAMRLVVSCEHGGHDLPARWAHLGRGREALLASHRGWDPGALELAAAIARRYDAPLVAAMTTRLLVELNRSPGHPRLFSELSRHLPPTERQALLDEVYHPHRERVAAAVAEGLAEGDVLHLAIHTFTPVWDGEERDVDVGLLYDPRRPRERALCAAWRRAIGAAFPDLRVRRNFPYRGVADGLATAFRRRFATQRYLGVELEVSQRFPLAGGAAWAAILARLPVTLDGFLACAAEADP